MQPTLTIVIPTYGRRSALFDTLASLETMEGRESTEIVVVDDGSPDDTWRFLESWMSPKDGRRAFRQENAGVLAARNRGSLEASAPVILFMDDDIEPPADLVVRYTALMELHSDSWISGPYRLPEFAPETPFEQFLEQTLQEWDAAYPEHPTRDGNQPLGGNLCVRREEFRAIGGFDESLRMGGEELDLVLRARGRGIHLRYDPSVGVIHHESHRTLESFVARKRRYSAASLELWRRYGEETGLSGADSHARASTVGEGRRRQSIASCRVSWPGRSRRQRRSPGRDLSWRARGVSSRRPPRALPPGDRLGDDGGNKGWTPVGPIR